MKNTTSFFFILLTYLSLSSCIPEINSINAASNRQTDDEVMKLYEEWMMEHRKVYDALTEKTNRFEIFKENLRYIEEHNNLSNGTYKLGLNQFSDLTYEEFESMYLSNNIPVDDEYESDWNYYVPEAISSLTLPDSVDWREKGALTPIKYQGRCGSCWAFSAIASVEAINYINTGNLVSLSEQMLVDCVTTSHGCAGGHFKNAFEFMTSSGVAQDIDYPYIAVQGPCQEKNITVKIDGYRKVKPRDEGALLSVAATQVISVSVKSNKNVQHYSSGIFSGKCGEELNHSMNVVGYGSEKGNKYWILRSSWSERWGEKGYMKMIRDVEDPEGHCGIAIRPSFPVINSSHFGVRSVI